MRARSNGRRQLNFFLRKKENQREARTRVGWTGVSWIRVKLNLNSGHMCPDFVKRGVEISRPAGLIHTVCMCNIL